MARPRTRAGSSCSSSTRAHRSSASTSAFRPMPAGADELGEAVVAAPRRTGRHAGTTSISAQRVPSRRLSSFRTVQRGAPSRPARASRSRACRPREDHDAPACPRRPARSPDADVAEGPTMPASDLDAAIQTLSTAYPVALFPCASRQSARRADRRSSRSGSIRDESPRPPRSAADLRRARRRHRLLGRGLAAGSRAGGMAAAHCALTVSAGGMDRPRHGRRPTSRSGLPGLRRSRPSETRTTALASGHGAALPDEWVAIAYRGGREIARATSSPVTQPLQLTFRPDISDTDPSAREGRRARRWSRSYCGRSTSSTHSTPGWR